MNKKWIIIGVVLIVVLSGMLAGCGGGGKSGISGKYFHQDDPESYLELYSDGTFYLYYDPGLDFGTKTGIRGGLSGTYKVDGNTIIISSELGAAKLWIDDDELKDEQNNYWLKEGKHAKEEITTPMPTHAPAPAPLPTLTSEPADFELWAEAAITWAKDHMDSYDWYDTKEEQGYCMRFVANAFRQKGPETEGEWNSAWQASQNLVLYEQEEVRQPPRGALIFFDKTDDNQYGHVGIHLGNGAVIHAYGKVRIDDVADIMKLDEGELIGSYLGWAYPPERWRPQGTTPTPAPAPAPPPTPSPTPEEKPVEVTPSAEELFVLEKEGVYRETSSAKGKLKLVINEIGYSPEGEKYWRIAFENITNRVCDAELSVDWKDSSGKSIETEERKTDRFVPGDTWGYEFKVLRGALGPVFWIEVEYAKPIPSEVTLAYVEAPSAKGKIEVTERFEIWNEGTVYEKWQLATLDIRNVSTDILLEMVGSYEFLSDGRKLEEMTMTFEVTELLKPGEVRDIASANNISFTSVARGTAILLPYEANEVRFSLEIEKVLPSNVTIDFDIDPTIEVWEVTSEPPSLESGKTWGTREEVRWVVSGEIDSGDGWAINRRAPGMAIEFHITFDNGAGELVITLGTLAGGEPVRFTGNSIVQILDLQDKYDRRFDIIYPLEASRASVRITRIR